MSEEEDQPIPGLADLESPVSEGFFGFLRNKIFRRTATVQFANFSFKLPQAIFMEFLSIIVHLFAVVDGRKDKPQ